MTPIPETSKPAKRAFEEAGFTSLESFTKVSANNLLNLHGVGPKAVRILTAELAKHNLSFKKP